MAYRPVCFTPPGRCGTAGPRCTPQQPQPTLLEVQQAGAEPDRQAAGYLPKPVWNRRALPAATTSAGPTARVTLRCVVWNRKTRLSGHAVFSSSAGLGLV